MSFWGELKRRNVFRVGAAYLVVAWLLLQVVGTVGPILALPDAFARGVLLLLAIGFPLVLVGSWALEFTPEGLKTQVAADDSGYRTSATKLNAVVIVGLVLALLFVVLDAYVLFESGPQSGEKAVAVLPFINNSSDPEQEYFADGLTDELITRLGRVPDLRIPGRESLFYFKGRNEDLRVIGESLGVDYVLRGSVSKAGDDIRIYPQLVNVADGFELWGRSFDFELLDIFAVQDEIASQVTRALEVTLATGDFSLPGNTRDVDAYDSVMRSNFETGRATPEAYREAIRLAQGAVNLDPNYARGWLALRRAYSTGSTFLPAEETVDFPQRARDARQRAEAIAPDLWEVRLSMFADAIRSGQYLNAFRILETAHEERALPESEYDFNRGVLSSLAGQNQDALVSLQSAKLLNPFVADLYFNLAIVLANMGRYEEAQLEITRGEALAEESRLFSGLKSRIARQLENWAEAEATYIGSPGEEIYLVLDRYLQIDSAQAGLGYLREFLETNQPSVIVTLALAEYASRFGDSPLALELLKSASDRNTGGYIGMSIWHPAYSTVRRHSGFKALVKDLGFVDYWRTTDNWGDYCRPLDAGEDFECF